MTKSEPMLSVAQVCEMQPSEDPPAWINPGFTAVVSNIKATTVKATGRPMNICTLRDTTGSATISMTVFNAVKFAVGDQIEVSGGGLRRTEYNGLAQVSMGKTSEVHLIGKSVHHEEQEQRAAALQPAVNGTKPHVNGQTVGMALKAALDLHSTEATTDDLNSPEFWKQIHKTASAIIRLSNALEHGNLTPAMSPPKPAAPADPEGGRADPTPAKAKPPAGENGQAFPTNGPDEDVPF